MPTFERVRDFIRRVESHDYAGALLEFYQEDAVAQDNFGEPRRGRDALVAHEIDLATRFGVVPVRKVERFAVNGDLVFINWVFEFRQEDGSNRVLDEIAMQTWRGDRIAEERFYYDPAQTLQNERTR
jgi:ketosteroid isomerase-like protein